MHQLFQTREIRESKCPGQIMSHILFLMPVFPSNKTTTVDGAVPPVHITMPLAQIPEWDTFFILILLMQFYMKQTSFWSIANKQRQQGTSSVKFLVLTRANIVQENKELEQIETKQNPV